MPGQGSPHPESADNSRAPFVGVSRREARSELRCVLRAERHRQGAFLTGNASRYSTLKTCVRVTLCVALTCLFASLELHHCAGQITGVAPSTEIELKLRMAWGGGSPTPWRGRVSLSTGRITQRTSLGLSPDAPGRKLLENDTLIVLPSSPTGFDGVDIELRAPEDSVLRVELSNANGGGEKYSREIPLTELLAGRHLEPMDQQGNWLSIQRSWGDQLHFEFTRDSLVFNVGETFRFDVRTFHCGLPAGTDYEVTLALRRVDARSDAWTQRLDATTDELGDLPPQRDLELPLPDQEGVYVLVCQLIPKRLGSPLLRPRPVLERQIQLVVLDQEARERSAIDWDPVFEFNPANPGWWERILVVPNLRVLPGMQKGPQSNDKDRVIHEENASWTELEPGGWVAYPLPLKQAGQLHLIEVEYAGRWHQSLGVSLIEPDATGHISPLGPDTGVVVKAGPGESLADRTEAQWQRMWVWPRTSVPWVVVHNLDAKQSARFGAIRVSAGTWQTSPDELPTTSSSQDPPDRKPSKRRFATLIDSPLLPESFSAAEPFDPIADRTLDDWTTFHQAAQRLIESLRLGGQRSAVVSVLNEGSTIYPSRLLDPTPKFDSGAYFSSGQDPLRKDVLEMMFRMFDREALTLIPQLEFASPLPAVEQALRESQRDGPRPTSIRLVHYEEVLSASSDRHPRHEPDYNPLSPEVQQAMLDVVEELVARYGHHASFGGISIRMGSNTYTHFRDDHWGYDLPTVHRYLVESGMVNAETEQDVVLRAYYRVVETRPSEFLIWRASHLAEFYGRMGEVVRRNSNQAQVYLSMANLFRSKNAVRALYPDVQARPAAMDATLLGLGLLPKQLHEHEPLTVLEPLRMAPAESLAAHRVEHHLELSGALDASFQSTEPGGSFMLEVLTPVILQGFRERSPFGDRNEDVMLFPRLRDADMRIREAFVRRIADRDERFFIAGSMLASPNDSAELKSLIAEFQQLPDQPFEDIPVTMPSGQRAPIVLRRCQLDGQTYLYAVNTTPWKVSVEIAVDDRKPVYADSLTDREVRLIPPGRTPTMLRLSLDGFDLIGAVIESDTVRLGEIQVRYVDPVTIAKRLDEQLRLYQSELNLAVNRPLPWSRVVNYSFEDPSQPQAISGWNATQAAGTSVFVDPTNAHDGKYALRVASDGKNNAWVRSAPIEVPQTGRLSISVQLRLDGPTQPPLRLALEGRHFGEEYYRFAEVGALAPQDSSRQLTGEWKSFGVHFDDLPPEGLTDLRIGFDLMGAGSVWIDNVQVYDLWLDEEADFLTLVKKLLSLTKPLEEGDYVSCLRYLESYWARTLLDVPSKRRPSTERLAELPAEDTSRGSFRNVLDRVKGLAPQKILPFR